jgi:ATP-dependent Clp protease ATP-binding subunit ClpB
MDEVEKAHPDVFNLLLQVLDDGRLTDGHGRTVDFRNTVIIMTSNLGSDRIQEMTGEAQYDRMKRAVMEVVAGHFRPEFLNRIDDMTVFRPLGTSQLQDIIRIQVGLLAERLKLKSLGLEVSEPGLALLVETGFDPVYGARPLKRAIQTRLENPLAQEILAGHFQPGDTVVVEMVGDELVFASKAATQFKAA